ncbi:hypothetical protein QOZ80_2AG0109700 [Eleusine coracana subsp. coracana]|nr:hypothetical protein QOZ80_2AG0109700 [Eleusine coracana subsp. coracana]
MESQTKTALAAFAAAISIVLGDFDLVCEILIRLALPDSLVRAAAVCRLWLRAASHPAFLRRFRDLHPPPGVLGFYLTTNSPTSFAVEFVPVQQPHPPAVAALLRRARFGLDGYVSHSTRVLDCRDGKVVASLFRNGDFTFGVHTPLNPAKGLDAFPRLPVTDAMCGRCWVFKEMLSKESDDGGVSYIWFTLDHSHKEDTATGCVYVLEDDAWHMRLSASTQIPHLHGSMLKTMSIFLADDKIYMGITKDNALVLDLTSSTFSTIEFHDEMSLDGEVRLGRGSGSGFYLVHVNELQLCIWFHGEGNAGVGDWALLHTVDLRAMLSNLNLLRYSYEVYIHEVWQNADFVFLGIRGCVLCLDVKSRELQKVHEMAPQKNVCWIHPFIMTWPPIFPALKE